MQANFQILQVKYYSEEEIRDPFETQTALIILSKNISHLMLYIFLLASLYNYINVYPIGYTLDSAWNVVFDPGFHEKHSP